MRRLIGLAGVLVVVLGGLTVPSAAAGPDEASEAGRPRISYVGAFPDKFYPTRQDGYRDSVEVWGSQDSDYATYAGEVSILDDEGQVMVARRHGPRNSGAGIDWSGKDADGELVQPGLYTIRYEVVWPGGVETAESTVEVATGFRREKFVQSKQGSATASRKVTGRCDIVSSPGRLGTSCAEPAYGRATFTYRFRVPRTAVVTGGKLKYTNHCCHVPVVSGSYRHPRPRLVVVKVQMQSWGTQFLNKVRLDYTAEAPI